MAFLWRLNASFFFFFALCFLAPSASSLAAVNFDSCVTMFSSVTNWWFAQGVSSPLPCDRYIMSISTVVHLLPFFWVNFSSIKLFWTDRSLLTSGYVSALLKSHVGERMSCMLHHFTIIQHGRSMLNYYSPKLKVGLLLGVNLA